MFEHFNLFLREVDFYCLNRFFLLVDANHFADNILMKDAVVHESSVDVDFILLKNGFDLYFSCIFLVDEYLIAFS